MSSGSAIYVDNKPRPPHRFNHDVVGRGREYVNQAVSDDRCIIRIQAAVLSTGTSRYPLFSPTIPVACHVSTDTGPTVFRGGIANSLNLPQPVKPFHRRVSTFLGNSDGPWCRHEVWLSIGPDYLPVKVLFPVQLGSRGWEWKYDFPQWNVLGMTGVLKRRMLCMTPEQVYAFELP